MFRAFMLAALADHGYKVKVYGREIGGYKRLIPGLRTLSIVGGGNLPAAAVNRIYNQARIVLNIHNIFNQYVVALRVFEVSSAGGFQLTAYQRALDELFPHGMIETYRNQAELLDKVGYYLKNPEERRKKARAASVFAREHHTYLHRVDQILDTIFPHRA